MQELDISEHRDDQVVPSDHAADGGAIVVGADSEDAEAAEDDEDEEEKILGLWGGNRISSFVLFFRVLLFFLLEVF